MRHLCAIALLVAHACAVSVALAGEPAVTEEADADECDACALDGALASATPQDGVYRPAPDASDPEAVKAQSSACSIGRGTSGAWLGAVPLLFLLRRRRR